MEFNSPPVVKDGLRFDECCQQFFIFVLVLLIFKGSHGTTATNPMYGPPTFLRILGASSVLFTNFFGLLHTYI